MRARLRSGIIRVGVVFNNKSVMQTVLCIGLMLLCCISSAYAIENRDASLAVLWHNVADSGSTIMKITMLIAAVIGMSYVAMGLFSLKAASDSAGQQNQNLQKGVSKLIIGGLLVSLPFVLYVSHNTVVGQDSDSGIYIPTEASASEIIDENVPGDED